MHYEFVFGVMKSIGRDKSITNDRLSHGVNSHKLSAPLEQTITLVIPRWLYLYVPLILGVLSIIGSWWITNLNHYNSDKTVSQNSEIYGWKAIDLFLTYDIDGDLYLSVEEAVPLLLKLVGDQGNETENADALPGEDLVTIEATLTPLNLSTMMRSWQPEISNYSVEGLLEWTAPILPLKTFGVSKFQDLLPQNPKNFPPPGTIYTIIDPGIDSNRPLSLPSNIYYPPKVQKRGQFLHRLFSMLHPHPFLVTRFDPQGAFGCVRAVSKDYVEVVFRLHVEFQLNEPPRLPFWFTPAQFTGQLLMSRDLTKVLNFHLYVPNDRRLNVDMEWLIDMNEPEVMEVDIGYLPHMELINVAQSKPHNELANEEINSPVKLKDTTKNISSNIQWDVEISENDAMEALALKFFPFKKVKYYNLSDAFNIAAAENKLVHSLVLWGALDDQSC